MSTSRIGTQSAARPKGRRRYLLIPLVMFVALAGVCLRAASVGGDPSVLPSALIGAEAPKIDVLPPLDGLARDGTPVPGFRAPISRRRGDACQRLRLVVRAVPRRASDCSCNWLQDAPVPGSLA
jgi:hypothetical protein